MRALEAVCKPHKGELELLFTYDEEFGEEMVTAHNGCLQLEVTVHGQMAHAAIPESGVDALQAATQILNVLYAQNTLYKSITSQVPDIIPRT